MKRLLLVLVTATVLGYAFGATNSVTTSQKITINFPKFVYVWTDWDPTNDTLSFDLDSTNTSSSPLIQLSRVFNPSREGLFHCLTNNASDPSSFTPSGTYNGDTQAGTAKVCYFAPSGLPTTRAFNTAYYDPDTGNYDNVADSNLLIFTTGPGWQVDASIDAALPAGLNLVLYPFAFDTNTDSESPQEVGFVKLTGTTTVNDTPVTLADGTSLTTSGRRISNGAYDGTTTMAYGYYVSGSYWMYLQPLNLLLKLDTSSYTGGTVNAKTYTLTYTINAP